MLERGSPVLPVADQAIPLDYFCDLLGEGAREQLHVQFAHGLWAGSCPPWWSPGPWG